MEEVTGNAAENGEQTTEMMDSGQNGAAPATTSKIMGRPPCRTTVFRK